LQKTFVVASLMLGLKISLQKKKKDIYMASLKKDIRSIFNLMKILTIMRIMKDQKTQSEIKLRKITL